MSLVVRKQVLLNHPSSVNGACVCARRAAVAAVAYCCNGECDGGGGGGGGGGGRVVASLAGAGQARACGVGRDTSDGGWLGVVAVWRRG